MYATKIIYAQFIKHKENLTNTAKSKIIEETELIK